MTLNAAQRLLVKQRAGYCCEYCRIAEGDRLSSFHIDHIVSLKHGGTDSIENLCLACYKCNGYKGSNVAAIDLITGEAAKLYNPRQQQWDVHFRLNADCTITGLTSEGRVTVSVLRLNAINRVQNRQLLTELNIYPCQQA